MLYWDGPPSILTDPCWTINPDVQFIHAYLPMMRLPISGQSALSLSHPQMVQRLFKGKGSIRKASTMEIKLYFCLEFLQMNQRFMVSWQMGVEVLRSYADCLQRL